MAETDLIVLRNIAKTYRRGEESISIFTDLNLTIPSGDFVAMMGPSGSGKTTLLNLLGGLDRPTSGTILLMAHPSKNCPRTNSPHGGPPISASSSSSIISCRPCRPPATSSCHCC
jgi:ABC-type Fe3+/spermidine/putrescine transport system ATPase subunit